jgi:quinoprotein relay system zinc metallohydrolase 2
MFEAFATICAIGAADICRDALLPGHAAVGVKTCEAGIALPSELQHHATVDRMRCETRPGSMLEFVQAAPGVYLHRGAIAEPNPQNSGDIANVGFVVGETSVALIDTGGSRLVGEQVYLAIRAATELPISHVILTHMHPDHVLGASVFSEAGARVFAHAGLQRSLMDRADAYLLRLEESIGRAEFLGTSVVLPDVAVATETEIDLGGRRLVLSPHPTAHTTNDLSVFDDSSKILFAGDLLFDEHTPSLEGSLPGWQRVMEEMMRQPAAGVVPGHGGPMLDWPKGAAPEMRYLTVLEHDVRAALDDGLSLSDAVPGIAREEAPDWDLFDIHNPRNATVAYTELEWQ